MLNGNDFIAGFALPRFRDDLTLAEYETLDIKDKNTLYFITDAGFIYKGDKLYGTASGNVTELPPVGEALPGVLYIIPDGDGAGVYVLNGEKDGYNNVARGDGSAAGPVWGGAFGDLGFDALSDLPGMKTTVAFSASDVTEAVTSAGVIAARRVTTFPNAQSVKVTTEFYADGGASVAKTVIAEYSLSANDVEKDVYEA